MITIEIVIKEWVLWIFAGWLLLIATTNVLSLIEKHLQRKINKKELELNNQP